MCFLYINFAISYLFEIKCSSLSLVMLNTFMYSSLKCYPLSNDLQHFRFKQVFPIRVENSVDPDQMASPEASCSGSTVFSKTKGLNKVQQDEAKPL